MVNKAWWLPDFSLNFMALMQIVMFWISKSLVRLVTIVASQQLLRVTWHKTGPASRERDHEGDAGEREAK